MLALALSLGAASAEAAAPLVTVEDATPSYVSAHVEGEVDPQGKSTNYRFQYATQADFSDAVTGVEGFGLEAKQGVEGDLTGLKPGTTYHLRLVADNADGSGEAVATNTFTTLAVTPPTVVSIQNASNVGFIRATAKGVIDRPAGADPAFDAHCRFEVVSDVEFKPRNEEQKLFVRAGGGFFALVVNSERTYEIPFDATAAEVQEALEALTQIGPGNVTVSGGPGDETASAPYSIVYGGALAGQNVTDLGGDGGELIGPNHDASVQIAISGHGEIEFQNAAPTPCNIDPLETPGNQEVEAVINGLSPNTTYHLRLTAENAGGSDSKAAAATFTTPAAPLPTVSIDPIVNPGTDFIDVTSQVNPNGTPTGAWFEISEDNGKTWLPAPFATTFCIGHIPECLAPVPVELGEGTTSVPFGQHIPEPDVNTNFPGITPLEPSTTYLLRVHARNAAGDAVSSIESTRTKPVPPITQTLSAGPVSASEATLSGRINPRNALVDYQFEWGEVEGAGDASYEHVAPAAKEALGFTDSAFHTVTEPISGLAPNTDYHYRLVAINTESGVEVQGGDRVFSTPPAPVGPPACPNEASRVGASAGLPNCRAFEWVTPDINGVFSEILVGVPALADGSAIRYRVPDAPDKAEGAFSYTWVVSRRGPDGWSSESRSPKISDPLEGFFPAASDSLFSSDLSENLVYSTNPLAGNRPPGSMNLYLRKADGSYVAISNVGAPQNADLQWGINFLDTNRASADFKRFFFAMEVRQIPTDPINRGNLYEWFNGNVEFVGYLPPATPGGEELLAPEGAALAEGALPALDDTGTKVLFTATGKTALYMRVNGSETLEVSASKRATEDPNPPQQARSVGITPDGSKAFFISKSELTEDANTGEAAGGGSNDAGADLYEYDVATKALTDLTVDGKAEDALTGANVQRVLAATKDGSYIYFVAKGNLASGALSGQENLYVLHNGEIDFVAPEGGAVYMTPDGTHILLTSTAKLTGYENAGHAEVYRYNYRGALTCVSCRPSGEPPTGDAGFQGRGINDSGTRVFFESEDVVLPQAINGVANVYEWEGGQISLLNPGDAHAPTHLVNASASGDDVFLATHEEFFPGTGSPFAIYDARVNADTNVPVPPSCTGENCLSAGTTAPKVPTAGSSTFEAPGRIQGPPSAAVSAAKAMLRVSVPGAGQVTVTGKGLKSASKKVGGEGMVSIPAALAPGANKKRLQKGSFRTKARVVFKASSGETSAIEVAVQFKHANKKGGK